MLSQGVPYQQAWQINPLDALDILGISANNKKSNANGAGNYKQKSLASHSSSYVNDSRVNDSHMKSDGRKLVARYRQSQIKD